MDYFINVKKRQQKIHTFFQKKLNVKSEKNSEVQVSIMINGTQSYNDFNSKHLFSQSNLSVNSITIDCENITNNQELFPENFKIAKMSEKPKLFLRKPLAKVSRHNLLKEHNYSLGLKKICIMKSSTDLTNIQIVNNKMTYNNECDSVPDWLKNHNLSSDEEDDCEEKTVSQLLIMEFQKDSGNSYKVCPPFDWIHLIYLTVKNCTEEYVTCQDVDIFCRQWFPYYSKKSWIENIVSILNCPSNEYFNCSYTVFFGKYVRWAVNIESVNILEDSLMSIVKKHEEKIKSAMRYPAELFISFSEIKVIIPELTKWLSVLVARQIGIGKEGYHDWKIIAETLKQHEWSPNHEASFLKWKELEIRINNSNTIDNVNEKIIKTEIQHWRQVIERIISLIRVLGNQNLALRRTHDKLNIENNDNFLKFIEFLVLDTGIQSIIERFDKLSEHNGLFSFLYNISIIEDENELLKHWKDLQLSLTSNDGLNTDINALELHPELISFKRCSRNEKSDPSKVLEYICKRKMVELFPNLVTALKILLTLSITAASAERSFSKMKIMKNYLRS
ncbi:HAT, C-terminal dimerisation domain [Cinara cedri]|uniref:HAT, C-terminal dimerisation domain n=1 Tax=Cinara cedri TaxID=506608 RepID=A0A5E4N6G3_9HEMI|nr:HAT, C-terminal dimerisation domain [Cinara cedri]